MTVQTAMRIVTYGFAFILGALIGSFLNVVIWRVPRGESIVSPPSHCPGCGAPIRWYQNVPILSWVLLRGHCAGCGTRIDLRYPVVELLTGLLAVGCVVAFGLSPMAARMFAFVALLLALTYIDLDHWILPHSLTWPGIALGLATAGIPGGPGWVPALIGAGAGWLGFWIIRTVAGRLLGKEALGGGDLWLLAMIGAFLGWRALLPVVFLASLQGSVIGLLLLAFKGRGEEEVRGDEEEGRGHEESGRRAEEEGRGQEEEGCRQEYEGLDGAPAEQSTEALRPGTNETPAAPQVAVAAEEHPGSGDAHPPADTEARDSEPEDGPLEDEDWVPPPTAVPFGPFLALGALEMTFAGGLILDLALRFLRLR